MLKTKIMNDVTKRETRAISIGLRLPRSKREKIRKRQVLTANPPPYGIKGMVRKEKRSPIVAMLPK
jgi:hypothetical protein